MNQKTDQLPSLREEHKKNLVAYAKNSIHAHLNSLPSPEINKDPFFAEKWGAFVTIYMSNNLRGCIGRMETDKPLSQTINEISIAAATEDPRFFPMRVEDLENFDLKISLLTPMKISTVDEIKIGVHGVLIEHAGRRGVLLPQVPVEQGWGLETFLENVCIKAGLPKDTWKKNPKIYTFTSIEFGN